MSNIYANNINPRSGDTVTFPQNIKVLGTATYEDVANVDSVGIVTAQSGIVIDTQDTSATSLSIGSKGGGSNDGHLEGEGPKITFLATRSADGANGSGAYIQQKAIGDLSTSYPVDLAFGVRRFGSSFEAIRILSTGNVGIGTDNPQKKLHVNGTSDFIVDTDAAGLRFGSYGEHDIALVTGRNTPTGSSRLYIENGNGEALRITSAGTLESYSLDDTTPNIKFRSNDTNWFGSLNQSVEGGTITSFLSCGGDWSADGTTYSATKALAAYPTSAIAVHNQYNSTWGSDFVFLTKAGGSSTTDGAVTERLRITSDGSVVVGSGGASRTGFFNVNAITPALQIETTGPSDNGRFMSIVSNAGASAGYSPTLLFGKSRGNGVGAVTGVAQSDELGAISWQGADGGQMVESARIAAEVAAATGTDNIPGRIRFHTNYGTSSPTLALEVSKDQHLLHYGATGLTGGVGGATCTKRFTASAGSTVGLNIPGSSFVGTLYVTNVYISGANARTVRSYFVAGRLGAQVTITQLNSANGTSGISFTITDGSSSGVNNTLLYSNTSTVTNVVSMHFVGAIGL